MMSWASALFPISYDSLLFADLILCFIFSDTLLADKYIHLLILLKTWQV